MKVFLRPTHASTFEGIELNDILLLESRSNYTHVHTTSGMKPVAFTMKRVLETIKQIDVDDSFVRISRMTVINKNHVTGIQGNSLMVAKRWYTISREDRKNILGMFTFI